MKKLKRRDIVFVEDEEDGRVALYIKKGGVQHPKPYSRTPKVDGLNGEFTKFEFPDSNIELSGVQRRFWLIIVSHQTFRTLLRERKTCLRDGTPSIYGRTVSGPVQNLLLKGWDALNERQVVK